MTATKQNMIDSDGTLNKPPASLNISGQVATSWREAKLLELLTFLRLTLRSTFPDATLHDTRYIYLIMLTKYMPGWSAAENAAVRQSTAGTWVALQYRRNTIYMFLKYENPVAEALRPTM